MRGELSKAGEGTTARGDEELVRRIGAALRASGIFRSVLDTVRAGGSTWFMRRVQERGGEAAYMALGADIAAPHHNGRFDVDERGMILGARAMAAIAESLLGQ